MLLRFALFGLVAGACSAREPAAPVAEGRREDDPARWRLGEVVTAHGRVSTLPEQHMLTNVPGKKEAYFDVVGHGQTIVYWTAPPSCPSDIEVTGKVLEVRSRSKQVGERESKIDDEGYVERQLDVTRVRCLGVVD